MGPQQTQKQTAPQAGCLPQHQPCHGEGCVTEGHPESPSIPVQQFSTELIVISYFVLGRKPLSEILLAVGAHVTLSMHSSPFSYSTKRLANLLSCVRQMLWHLTDDFSTEMNFFGCAVYFGTPLCSTRVNFLVVVSQTSLEEWESSGKNYS